MNQQKSQPLNQRVTSFKWILLPLAACVLAFGLLLGILLPSVSYSQQQHETNCVPKPNKKYKGPSQMLRDAHFRNGGKKLKQAKHKPYRCLPIPPPDPGAPPRFEPFNSGMGGVFQPGPGIPPIHVAMPAASLVKVQFSHAEPATNGGITYVYDNELLALDASSPAFPGFLIRESPTLVSTGQTRVTFGPTGIETGLESFFDVYTELSTDDGMTWLPSIDDTGAPYAGHMELGDEPPEYVFPTDACPPPGVSYLSPTSEVAITFANGIKARNFQHSNLTNPIALPPLGGSAAYTAPDTVVQFEYSTDGGATYVPARATANTTVNISLTDANGDTRFFDTEIVALDITGGNLPPGFRLRESPTEVSLGDHTVRYLPGGGFGIRSSFAVQMELSTDGGATWSPADSPKEVVLTPPGGGTPIPTLSEWGLIILTVLMLGVGAWYLRRQRQGTVLPSAG